RWPRDWSSDVCSSDLDASDEQVAARRAAEQRAAAAVLGVSTVAFLGLRDGQLAPTLILRRAIAAQVRRERPTLVLTHYPRRVLRSEERRVGKEGRRRG